jgi:anti-sigma regulatory factor (Ser/Thr protein kinase)
MEPTAMGMGDAPLDPGAAVLGSLTIPGRPEHVREARAFVAKALGELHRSLDTAVLLTSELVTNAVTHSNSRCQGGTVALLITESSGGVRIEVTDQGSDLSSPVVRGDVYASDGHGLFLVQTLAEQWGYLRKEAGTTVWFWLSGARPTAQYSHRDPTTLGSNTRGPSTPGPSTPGPNLTPAQARRDAGFGA